MFAMRFVTPQISLISISFLVYGANLFLPTQCFTQIPSNGWTPLGLVEQLKPFGAAEGFALPQGNRIKSTELSSALKGSLEHALPRPALIGRIVPVLSKLLVTNEKFRAMFLILKEMIHPVDLIVLCAFWWLPVPVAKFLHGSSRTKKEFRETNLFQITNHVRQASKIAGAAYCLDVLLIILTTMGFKIAHHDGIGRMLTQIAYTVWAAHRLVIFKRGLLTRKFAPPAGKPGEALLYDQVLNCVIYSVAAFLVLEMVSLDMGMTVSYLLSLGGAGTLVFGLALKDPAMQFFNGIALSASDRFRIGDEIKTQDGTEGIINRIGLMHTTIRGFDEIDTKISNEAIYKQSLSNISRMTRCRVKQNIRFEYKDVDRVPAIIDDIKLEVSRVCPKLITDGSRPFRVHMTDFNADHINVVLNLHFNLPPHGDAYHNNRQQVLEAVARAMKKNNALFSIPSRQVTQIST